MTKAELEYTLQHMRNLTAETEVVEFKEAKNGYDFTKLGKYFSALSNEANLKGKPHAWLVFGIENSHHNIVNSQYRPHRKDLDSLKSEIAGKTTNRITFIEIYELILLEGRVVMFQIPAAPKGFPIAFDGHYYGRDNEELVPLNLEEIERIRAQATTEDSSAAIVPEATIDDLDEDAIALARKNYKNKFPEKASEVDIWNDITFLNKAKITIKGKITRTAIILLGKEESEHFINPAEAKVRWLLKDARLLAQNKELALEEIILLDKVQKKQPLTTIEENLLKSKKLIEGRKPNFFIGIKVAQKTGQKASYTKNKAFDKQYYLDLIIKSIKQHKSLSRKDVDELLWNKLPDWMNDKQRKYKIGNLLSELRIKGEIENVGIPKEPKWIIYNSAI